MKYNKKEELEKAAKYLLNLKETINLLDIVIRDAALDDGDSLALQIIVKKYNKVYKQQLTHYDEMRSNGK
jgi:hypothetical protein|tara:strand:+ start:7724 stop:7933 length:210 start_codon:yes stop_codon:yes gene_type:complete